ncbi:MAG: DNA polymerase III subunit delta [Lachnospiraceae bacterium]|nr:DNA polymerase III subunit delta [Lachnospiraceae bacterium]
MSAVSDSLKTKSFARAYLLYGTEGYLRRFWKNELKRALVAEGDTLNYSYYEGKDTDVSEVMAQLSTMPFMAEHRVVVVENSGWFGASGSSDEEPKSSGKTDGLTDAVKELQEDVILIFVEEKADKRSKLFKAVGSVGIVEEFGEQSEESLARWLINQSKAAGFAMSPATAMYLLSEAGKDMTLLENEFRKLSAYCYGREAITTADIDEVCTHQINNKIFDMITAIASHKPRVALDLYNDLVLLRESPFHILTLLVRQYDQMLKVKDGLNRGYSSRIIEEKTGIKDWLVRKTSDLCRKLTLEDIKTCLKACADTDEAIKKGNTTDSLGVEMLITGLSGAAGD